VTIPATVPQKSEIPEGLMNNPVYKEPKKMHFSVYDVFYPQFSHQHISAAVAAIFRVILLQEYRGTNVVSCVIVTP
jgi:hypothetical protein